MYAYLFLKSIYPFSYTIKFRKILIIFLKYILLVVISSVIRPRSEVVRCLTLEFRLMRPPYLRFHNRIAGISSTQRPIAYCVTYEGGILLVGTSISNQPCETRESETWRQRAATHGFHTELQFSNFLVVSIVFFSFTITS